MDRFVNKKIEKQTIYEIYRACRLCGAGGGYKMPIIQNVVNLDNCDVELKQKIRECVQIEVHQDDKMPPLICELCVDKVNDFYEFLEMCRQTNKRTRLKLGLPPQMLPRGAPDAGDCILGVTEPIFVHDDDSNEPLADKRGARGGRELKRESRESRDTGKKVNVKIKEEKVSPRESRARVLRAPTPPPPRRARRPEDNVALSRVQSRQKKSQSPPPKSILKKGKKPEVSPVASPRLKRSREAELKQEAPAKRVKISLKPQPKPTKLSPRLKEEESKKRAKQREAKQREAKQQQREAEKQKELQTCVVCGGVFKTPQAMKSHRRCHVVTFTNPKLACNPCGEWFPTPEATETHHKKHRRGSLPYRCARCGLRAGTLQEYDRHIAQGRCLEWEEVPDVKCEACWKAFPTQTLLDGHRCAGVSARPGKCEKCGRSFSARRALTKHTKLCKKGVVIPPELRRRLKPLQVRVARCDPLLVNVKQERYDVSGVDRNYGLDKNCVYPYLSSGLRIKREPTDCMVKINDLDFGSYVHWDSEDDSGDSDTELDLDAFAKKRKVNSLAACALRTIFSKKFLGKVPKKFRRLKIETIIDSTLNDSLSYLNLNSDTVEDVTVSDKGGSDKVDDSVKSVDDSDKKVDDTEDDLFPKVSSDEQVTNDDFDSLFNDNNDKTDIVNSGDKLEASDDKTTLADKDSDESKDIKEPDDLDSGAKEHVDENGSVDVSSKENITESTNDIVEENLNEVKSLESQSDVNTNSEKDSTETILNSAKDITDDTQTKIDENPSENHNENINQIISNDKEKDTNKSEETLENHDSEINISTENKSENNEIDKGVSDEEKDGNSPNYAEGLETELEKTEPSNAVSKMETDDPNNDTTSSTDENKSKENIENNTESKTESIAENNKDSDPNIDEAKINGDTDMDDVALNMNDLEDFSGDEYDDTELMAEIDAQIGEKKKEEVEKEMEKEDSASSEKVTEVNKDRDNVDVSKKEIEISEKIKEETSVKEKEIEDAEGKDKIVLEDLLPKEDVKSMDLDSISDDEFDFND